ncbi:MAG: PAS domain S-box protein [Desulfosarcinaceae bacterium]|nr:PAS domain S-box protein [Desulfosarcinaceae bacterium]
MAQSACDRLNRYQALVETARDWMWEINANGVYTYVSPRCRDLLGYRPQEIRGQTPFCFMDSADAERTRQQFAESVRQGRVLLRTENRYRHRDGRRVILETCAVGFFGAGGRLAGYRGIDRDITVRAQSEEMRRYRELFDNVTESVIIFERRGRVLECNDTALAMVGYSRKEMLQLKGSDFCSAETWPALSNTLGDAWALGSARFELDLLTRDGATLPVEINARVVTYLNRQCLLCVGRDITERKAFQDKLIRSERLAATGQLAASIAHEINSPLQGVAALLSVIKARRPEDEEMHQNIDLIKGAFDSIRDTVRKLLDLNRPGRELKQPMDLNRLVADTLDLVRGHLRRYKVKVTLELADDLPTIIASSQQIGQVVLNLVNNAVEAMTGISTHDTAMKQRTIFGGEILVRTWSARAGDTVYLQVADNGPGISAEDLERVFDPFYTRKKTMGMGVGLSICHGIIEEHHGTIGVENGLDGGATFIVMLPVEPPKAAETDGR